MTSNFPSEKKIYKRVMKDMTKNRKIECKCICHKWNWEPGVSSVIPACDCPGCVPDVEIKESSTPEPSEEWERELYRIIDVYRSLHASVLKASVRDFISTLLAQREKEIIEKIEKFRVELNGSNPNKRIFDVEHTKEQEFFCRLGANIILTDILSTLSEAGEKGGVKHGK